MCPTCFATIALLATGLVSTGGVTAAAVKLLRNKKISKARKPEFQNGKEKSQ